MTALELKEYIIKNENIYPDSCVKENFKFDDYDVFYLGFNNKDIGLPIFYLVKNNIIKKCDNEDVFKILDLAADDEYI